MKFRQKAGTAQGLPRIPLRPVAIRIGTMGEADRGYRVTDPARLFRAWTMLKNVNHELRTTEWADGGARRAAWLLGRLREEIGRSVSAPLRAELLALLPDDSGDVRIAYAALLGWTESLVSSMLLQLATLGQRRNPRTGRQVIGAGSAARPVDTVSRPYAS